MIRSRQGLQPERVGANKSQRCPVAHKLPAIEVLEQDFTTQGVQGTLGCPFSTLAAPELPHTPDSKQDPIAAEFNADQASVESVPQQGPKCPIRFLDQHSPEEVAQYFEKHKHEIPRSHEICVKRYHQNEASIRQLDAKYGSLVTMIQGLGVKHQPFLPGKDIDLDQQEKAPVEQVDKSSVKAVEEWAGKVNGSSEISGNQYGGASESQHSTKGSRGRSGEKELKEIRVGESPSRPWGIPVPLDQVTSASAEEAATAKATAPRRAGALGHNPGKKMERDAVGQSNGVDPASATTLKDGQTTNANVLRGEVRPIPGSPSAQRSPRLDSKANNGPCIVFNGPVLIGYAPEQAVEFLERLKQM